MQSKDEALEVDGAASATATKDGRVEKGMWAACAELSADLDDSGSASEGKRSGRL
jgi:hypothetical protein